MSERMRSKLAVTVDVVCTMLCVIAVVLVFVEYIFHGPALYSLASSSELYELRQVGVILWFAAGIVGALAATGRRIKFICIALAMPLSVFALMALMVSH